MASDNAITVLVVEDDPVDRHALGRALDGSPLEFELLEAETLAEGIASLRANRVDVVMLDLGLPDGDGLVNLAAIQEADPRVPVVILSGRVDESIALEAVKAGAQDFVNKVDLTTESAVRVISYAIERKLTETRLREGVSELEHAAQVDPLTGLLNRRAFLQHLDRVEQKSRSERLPVSCAMLDIDYFKHVNDTYGHPIGDEALRIVASLLLHESRAGDLVCRFGGEEFCVILLNTDERAAFAWADRVRKTLAETIVKTQRCDLQVTVSLGVAQASRDINALSELVDKADQALLASKQRGRNRVTTYSEVLSSREVVTEVATDETDRTTLGELAYSPISCLLLTDEISRAADRLLELRVPAMPVVDGAGRFVGLVSEKELLQAIPEDGHWCGTIEKIVDRTAMGFPSDAKLSFVREFMIRTQTAQVAVVLEQRPIGLLTLEDLLKRQRDAQTAHRLVEAV
ncbi:MAG: diguanylate cyclase [Lacipirellulaceae bacterium]